MGKYYLFAFFIFILVCAALFLYRYLFSDLKRQRQLLEEKETKLLRLYQTLEEVMDEYFDSVGQAKSELSGITEAIKRAVKISNESQVVTHEQPYTHSYTRFAPSAPVKVEAPEEPFQPLLYEQIETDTEAGEPPPETAVTRTDGILNLHRQGKSRTEIAREMAITLSEVDLVIGINKNIDE